MLDVAIVGAGLSGLFLATLLDDGQHKYAVFEANHRVGGRILSLPGTTLQDAPVCSSRQQFCYDLGPGWIWPDTQPHLANFVAQHNIEIFPQWADGKSLYQTDRDRAPQVYLDNPYAAARRICGGTTHLIDVMLHQIPAGIVKLNHYLREVVQKADHVELKFHSDVSQICVKARQVVITIPPRLLVDSVIFVPSLDQRLSAEMRNTITWMAGHAKAVIRYGQAFWRAAGYSGNVIATYQGAALAEIFDACSADGEQAALAGFFALPAALRMRYREDLTALIVEQLVRLFGKAAAQPEEIIIHDWFNEALTATSYDEFPPNYHPQYGNAWFQLDHWNDKLYFAGTETASQFGGYLEGALESAERVAKSLRI